jgi:hypothetical protein
MRNRLVIGPLLMGCAAAALAAVILSCNKPKGGQAADAQADQPRTGKIEVPVESFDFGDVNRGDTANHTFAIKNATNRPLKLVRAKGS